MKALIAIDGSEPSFQAIQFASGLLRPERDVIVLCHVTPTVPFSELVVRTIVEQGQASLADAILTETMKYVPHPWKSKAEQITKNGDACTEIVNTAHETQAEFIVVGARGIGSVARIFLGSVSRGVVRAAKIPVLVARNPHPINAESDFKVLVACENVATGRQIIAFVNRFPWPDRISCSVINVVPSVLGGSIPNWLATPSRSPEIEEMIKAWVEEQKREVASAREQMQDVLKSMPPGCQKSATIVAEGSPAVEIIDAAVKLHSDLIIVGTKGSTAFGRLFGGSTCESVLNHAPCSVLVVHHTS